jgi:hypothetical protein
MLASNLVKNASTNPELFKSELVPAATLASMSSLRSPEDNLCLLSKEGSFSKLGPTLQAAPSQKSLVFMWHLFTNYTEGHQRSAFNIKRNRGISLLISDEPGQLLAA